MSYSVVGTPSRMRRLMVSKARSLMRWSFSEAVRWLAISASPQVAEKRCTRSPEETTSTPCWRTSSTVPASTRAM
jgi:hypothetical protein